MKTIQIPDEYDMRAEVNNVLSCAYEGKDWCEDGSIRQDITDLKSNILDLDLDIDKLDDKINKEISMTNQEKADIEGLRATVLELVTVTNKHDVKLLAIATSLDAINQMLKILSKRTGIDDDN